MAAARGDEVLDLGAEDLRERGRQVEAVLDRAALEVRHRRQLQRPGSDARLDRPARHGRGDGVELGQPDGPALDRPADGDAARLVEREGVLALGPRARGVLELLVPEAADALEPVPEEGADPHRVVVEPHLPVGADVEAGLLLLADDRAHGVAERLLVVQRFEGLADVATVELVGEPGGPRVGADHRRRQEGQDVVHQGA